MSSMLFKQGVKYNFTTKTPQPVSNAAKMTVVNRFYLPSACFKLTAHLGWDNNIRLSYELLFKMRIIKRR